MNSGGKHMKKIAIISDHASPLSELGSVDSGGQNIYVRNIARYFAKKGFQVDVFTRKDRQTEEKYAVMEPGVRVVYVPAGPQRYIEKEKLLQYMGEFGDFMADFFAGQETPYDCIHANFFMSGLVAMRLKSRFNTPFFMTFHALGRVRRLYQKEKDGFPDERFRIEEEIVRFADGIIAECPQDKDDLVSFYSADPGKISIVPCGVDPKELYPVNKRIARSRLALKRHEKILLHLGRIVPRKGIDTIIQALPVLKKQHSLNVRLIVVGGPAKGIDLKQSPEISRLSKLAEEERVASQVDFCGPAGREMLKFYYSASDIFVTTPWYEPFGITPLEAMACATPVIGSKVGGIPFSIIEKRTGLLVPPQNPEALAEAVAFFYSKPGRMKAFGRHGRSRVKKHFTWEIVGDFLQECFEEGSKLPVYSLETKTKQGMGLEISLRPPAQAPGLLQIEAEPPQPAP